jgi:hypothetical protein
VHKDPWFPFSECLDPSFFLITMPLATKPWVVVSDADAGLPLSHYVIPDHYKDHLESVLIPHGWIQSRIDKLAQDIAKETQGPLSMQIQLLISPC